MPPPSHLNRSGLLAAFTFSVTWATTGATVKLLPAVSPLVIVAFRCLFAWLAFTALLAFSSYRYTFSPGKALRNRRAWPLIGIMVTYYFTVILSYQLAPVAEIVLINGCAPVFVLIYHHLMNQPTPRNQKAGAVCAMLGLGLIVLPGLGHVELTYPHYTTGLLIGSISSFIIALYAILYRNLEIKTQAPDQSSLTWVIFAVGTLFFFALSLPHSASAILSEVVHNHHFWLLLSLGVLSTAIPTIAYSHASRLLPPIITTSFRLLTPLTAILLAYLLVGEIPAGWAIPGGGLILLGLAIMVLP